MADSIIEEDMKIEGNVTSSKGSIEVKGIVVGDVTAEALVVLQSGSIDGALSAKTIAIEGKHKGSLKCDDLTFAASSHVQADVTAQTMTTESGAKVVGKVNITGGA
ncbi:bactofilin family protein [Roseobacter sp. A03A-229]